MPILANTNCSDRLLIREAFLPFARPDYVEGMLIGDDLDSLLSAMFLHQKFGWPVTGIYCQYTRIWHTGPVAAFREKLFSGKYIAVDLDIYHPGVPGLGHHIISMTGDEELPGHSHSLNPNALKGFSVMRNFSRKYPLATIHFLLWLFEESSLSPEAASLVWLADSAFINAQHYRDNVTEWVNNFCAFPAFSEILPKLQSIDFEENIQKTILDKMVSNPLCRPGRSKYKSKHLGINGFQCQFENPVLQNASLQALLALLGDLSGWRQLQFPASFSGFMEGKRYETSVQQIVSTGLTFGEWLEKEAVFSYAFTFKTRLNYTVLQ